MDFFMRALRSPGARGQIQGAAPTQFPDTPPNEKEPRTVNAIEVPNDSVYVTKAKKRMLDRWLDWIVKASGSPPVFLFIQALLVVWAFLGIPFRTTTLWPVVISDAQAIFSYAFDSLLMRQQLNGHEESLTVAAELRSRVISHSRMLEMLKTRLDKDELSRLITVSDHQRVTEFDAQLPAERWFGKVITCCSHVIGHVLFIALYWACITLWLGFGPSTGWSTRWQLDVNSATSALMVLVFSLLAIIRECHADYARKCLDAIYRVDCTLERRLRLLTGDRLTNDLVIIPAPRVSGIQRAINYYADVVGTLVGIAILIVVIVVWIVIGPIMSFSANWWLLIGTYAGLVGLNDGFVLRNVQGVLKDHENPEYAKIDTEDSAMFGIVGLPVPESIPVEEHSLSQRVSVVMGRMCAHEVTVILGFLLIVGLLAGASVMRWNTTGQLLCNIPPSIIETFFMIILITGHNLGDARRRVELRNIYERRLRLLSFIGTAGYLSTEVEVRPQGE